ncbi:MAG: PKD domain-containing protein [Candidatus Manganitrophaceae bacterium]|nr:MAG: PKD domain-containing protein [Candidatus Manganitrophaceae bacterium]
MFGSRISPLDRKEQPFCKKESVNRFFRRCHIPLRLAPTRTFRASAPLILSLCLIACGSGGSSPAPPDPKVPPSQPPAVSKIRIAPTSALLPVGASQQFVATALDGEGQEIIGIDFTWKIDNPKVGRLSSDSAVEGLEEGTATLTASFGEVISNPAILQVIPPPPTTPPIASIELTRSSQTLFVGNQVRFVATAKDADGSTISGVTFLWTSSAPEVVSIDQQGLATARAAGSATLTATAENGVSQSAVVTVSADNIAPTARITATATSGTVPFTVTFNAAGSSDPDGSILSNNWSFGDGSPAVKGAVVDHTYESAGEFTATLVVADNRGANGTASTDITANSPAPPPPGAGWQRRGVNGDLFGIHFVSASEGWSVGIDQVIAHTTDGGATWPLQKNLVFKGSPSPSAALIDFYDVFFTDAHTGWAVGWPEAIFKTADGGDTWVEQHVNRAPWTDRTGDGIWDRRDWCEVWNDATQTCSKKYGSYLRKVQFFDGQHGWTVGRFGSIFKTSNGGSTWQEIPKNSTVRPLPAPCLYPPEHPNAGQPRPEVTSFNPHLFTVDVITPNDVWIGGGSEGDEPCATGWLRMLGHTTDGGQHWQFFYEAEHGGQLEGHGRIFDMKFSRNAAGGGGAAGLAVGGNGTSQANVLQTIDGGQTWHQVKAASYPSYTNGFYGIALISPAQIWLTGWGGLILHSDDGGGIWSRQQAKTTSQLRRVFFLDEKTGWIAGQGQAFFTTSGGQ